MKDNKYTILFTKGDYTVYRNRKDGDFVDLYKLTLFEDDVFSSTNIDHLIGIIFRDTVSEEDKQDGTG